MDTNGQKAVKTALNLLSTSFLGNIENNLKQRNPDRIGKET